MDESQFLLRALLSQKYVPCDLFLCWLTGVYIEGIFWLFVWSGD
jgi:hypothetical protein